MQFPGPQSGYPMQGSDSNAQYQQLEQMRQQYTQQYDLVQETMDALDGLTVPSPQNKTTTLPGVDDMDIGQLIINTMNLTGQQPIDKFQSKVNSDIAMHLDFLRKDPGTPLQNLGKAVNYGITKLPFVGPVYEAAWTMADTADLRKALHNVEQKKHAKEDFPQWEAVTIAHAIKKAEDNQERSWAAKVLDLVSSMPGYAVEFAATGGAYAAGRAAMAKGVGTAATGLAGKAAQQVLPRAAGAAAQAAANPQMVARAFAQEQASDLQTGNTAQLDPDQATVLARKQMSDGQRQSIGESALRAIGDTAIEMVGERSGRLLRESAKMLGSKAGKLVPTALREATTKLMDAWVASKPGRTFADAKKFLEKGGFDGYLEELGEERVGDILRGVTQLDPGFGTTGAIIGGIVTGDKDLLRQGLEDFSVEAAGMALFQLGGTAAHKATRDFAPYVQRASLRDAITDANARRQREGIQPIQVPPKREGAVTEQELEAELKELKARAVHVNAPKLREWVRSQYQNISLLRGITSGAIDSVTHDPEMMKEWIKSNPMRADRLAQIARAGEVPSRSEWQDYGVPTGSAVMLRGVKKMMHPVGTVRQKFAEAVMNVVDAQALIGEVADSVQVAAETTPEELENLVPNAPPVIDDLVPPEGEVPTLEPIPETRVQEPTPVPQTQLPPAQPPVSVPVPPVVPPTSAPKQVREMDAGGRPKDGDVIQVGDVFRTATGRQTTPYPKYPFKRHTTPIGKHGFQWVRDNAVLEAISRGDSANVDRFNEMGSASVSWVTMLDYLFGESVAPEPTPAPPATGGRDPRHNTDPVWIQVADIALTLSDGKKSNRVFIADLRDRGIPGHQLQRVLLEMEKAGELTLYPLDDPREITRRVRDAAVYTPVGSARHILYYGYQPRTLKKTPNPAPVPTLKASAESIIALARNAPPEYRFHDKVFISPLWRASQQDPSFPKMTLEQFKQVLVDERAAGKIELSRIDIAGKMDPEIQIESEINYGGISFYVVKLPEVSEPEQKMVPTAPEPVTAFDRKFAEAVMKAARAAPQEHKFHDNKVYISDLWETHYADGDIRKLTLAKFKNMLLKAHQKGLIHMSRADLVKAMNMDKVTKSEIKYLNTSFHFVTLDPPKKTKKDEGVDRALRTEVLTTLDDVPEEIDEAVGLIYSPVPAVQSNMDWLKKPPTTKEGKDLLKKLKKDIHNTEKKGDRPQVGIAEIAKYMMNQSKVIFIGGRSQIHKKSGGHYELYQHVIRQATISDPVGFHEGGHAISKDFLDRFSEMTITALEILEAVWMLPIQKELMGLATQPGSRVSKISMEEGFAEFVRRYIEDHDSIDPAAKKAIENRMQELEPKYLDVIRDAHRAYALWWARPEEHRASTTAITKPPKEGHITQAEAATIVLADAMGPQLLVQKIESDIFNLQVKPGLLSRLDVFNLYNLPKMAMSKSYRDNNKIAREFRKKYLDTPLDLGAISHWINNHGHREARNYFMEDIPLRFMAFDDLTGKLIDPNLEETLKDLGMPLPKRATDHSLTWVEFEGVKSIPAIMQMAGGQRKWNDFGDWMQFRSALETYKKKPGYVIAGMQKFTPAAIERIVDSGLRNNPEWAEAAVEMRKIFDALLYITYEMGQIDLAEMVTIHEAHEYYAPTVRQFEVDPLQQRGTGKRGPEPKAPLNERGKGGFERMLDMDTQIQRRMQGVLSSYYANSQNRVLVKLAREAKTVMQIKTGKDGIRSDKDVRRYLARLAVPIKMDLKHVATMSKKEIDALYEKLVDVINQERADELGLKDVKELPNEETVDLESLRLSYAGQDLPNSKRIYRPEKPRVVNVMAVYERTQGKGGMEFYQVLNPYSWKLIEKAEDTHAAMKWWTAGTHRWAGQFRRTATKRPGFVFWRNVWLDIPFAFYNGENWGSLAPARDFYVGMITKMHNAMTGTSNLKGLIAGDLMITAASEKHQANMGTWSEDFWAKRKADALEGWWDYFAEFDDKSIAERFLEGAQLPPVLLMKPVELFFDAVTLYQGPTMETATRQGAWTAAQAKGLSTVRSQYAWDTISGDFSHQPLNPNFKAFVHGIPFFNAMLQLLRQGISHGFLEADPLKRGFHMAKMAPIAIATVSAAAAINVITMYGMRALGLWDDDELEEKLTKIKELPLETKLRMAPLLGIFQVPFEPGPMGTINAVSFHLMQDYLLDNERHPDETPEVVARKVLANMSGLPDVGDLIHPYIKLPMEVSLNYSFFRDRPLTPNWLKEKFRDEPHKQILPYTPKIYEKISKGLEYSPFELAKLNPLEVQHLVRGLMTSSVDDFLQGIDRIKTVREAADVPFVGSMFVRTPDGWASRSVQSLSDLDMQFQIAKRLMETAIKNKEPVTDEMRKKFQRLKRANQAMNTVARINRRINELKKVNPLPRDDIRAMQRDMRDTARRLILDLKPIFENQ